MRKYRFRLTFSILISIFFVLISLGILLSQLFKEFYYEQLIDRMSKEAKLIAVSVYEGGMWHPDLQSIVSHMGEQLSSRITVIDADGNVLAETHTSVTKQDNHFMRPEIIDARKEGYGQAVRFSRSVNSELLYYAVPLYESNEVVGFVRLALSIHTFDEINKKVISLIIISFTFAFLIIIVVSSKIMNETVKPIEEATKVAKQLAKGNFKIRSTIEKEDETGHLNHSLNVLAKNLSEITNTYQVQQERLETLIENMGSGLMFIDSKGEISLVNRSFKMHFNNEAADWVGKIYYDVILHKEIITFIQDVFFTEKGYKTHIVLPIQLDIRHFDVYGAPIISSGGKEESKGIVLVFHDITELKRLEQMRKDFVANVSHELKTPITSIKGFTETLIDGAANNASLRMKFLSIIWNESERLQTLIQDLLDLSKIEQSQFELNWQRVDLSMISDEILIILRNKAEEKNISLKKTKEGSSIVEGDPLRIKQIMINLVSNAIMYSQSNGEIEISITEDNDKVLLAVKDTGIGIRKEEIPRIFERFYRVDRARSRNSGGTGLGLAIVKHLVEAHQGEIKVHSEIGKGTIFTISFYKQYCEQK